MESMFLSYGLHRMYVFRYLPSKALYFLTPELGGPFQLGELIILALHISS